MIFNVFNVVHPVKMSFGADVIVTGYSTVVNLLHPLNAFDPIVFIVVGMVILVNPDPEKAYVSILVICDGMLKVESALHEAKQYDGIVVIDDCQVTVVNLLHPLKALTPIDVVTVDGMVILVNPDPEKA